MSIAPIDTIAAIATAKGAAGIGVIRVSGPKVPELASKLLGKPPKARFAHRVAFKAADQSRIDDGILIWFKAPHSYTGEEVLELQGHGAPVVMQMVLQWLHAEGVRGAEPGEFSKRAFLNGRIDLLQAEAVADLIAASSARAARAALRSLQGEFSKQVDRVLRLLIELRMWVEAAIDFPEEEIDFLADAKLLMHAGALHQALQTLLADAEQGRRLRDGAHVVIVGPPNAGKSSLLNALSGSERAIVTEIPGTTRDVLREDLSLAGMAITLVDTAGIRSTQDRVEAIGVARAKQELAGADLALVLWPLPELLAGSVESVNRFLTELPEEVPKLLVLSKCDLSGAPVSLMAELQAKAISAHSGEGLMELLEAVRARLGLAESSEGLFSARGRHVDALKHCEASVQQAIAQLHARQGELAAADLALAQRFLSELTGRFSADDLLGEIFGSFCIGK
jgi:tRNA modification GTPase